MNTLLISTDFSANAKHAAEYGYQLARQLMANIILCNAIIIPSEVPQAGMIVWPMDEFDILQQESDKELQLLKEHLEQDDHVGFHPSINCMNNSGTVTEVLNNVIKEHKVNLVIMGTHGGSGLSQLLLGNHSERMIDETSVPVILVPPGCAVEGPGKIAFATDFREPERDLQAIYSLVPLAKFLNAEILVAHVDHKKSLSAGFEELKKWFFTEISNKADYPRIYYTVLKEGNTESGLGELCGQEETDMLAMVHRPHNFMESLLKGSHTKKMARKLTVPLLVIPERSIT